MMRKQVITRCVLIICLLTTSEAKSNAELLSTAEAKRALHQAVQFFHEKVSNQGGFVWAYSSDLKLREGEGTVEHSRVWIQPPGTPAVAEAILNAYHATKDQYYLDIAKVTGHLLAKKRYSSGGWNYYIELDPAKQKTISKRSRNRTTLDDNTTQAALHFLIRLDKALNFKDPLIHNAAIGCLTDLRTSQYPIGGWHQNWQHKPKTPNVKHYPVISASYPETWSRKWLNDWTGKYYLNDNVQIDMLDLYLLAADVYDDDQWLKVAKKAGDFLLLAQMPDPQPAWAQQYNEKMHPVWDRKFEPPAISGGESQHVMKGLMHLYLKTGEKKYLEPIPRALAYFKKSLLPDGRLARFYELKTNRPLYFYIEKRAYYLTYDDSRAPDHYAFKIDSNLENIEREYFKLSKLDTPPGPNTKSNKPSIKELTSMSDDARKIIAQLDHRGAWTEQTRLRFHKVAPSGGIIRSATFIKNIKLLSSYIAASK